MTPLGRALAFLLLIQGSLLLTAQEPGSQTYRYEFAGQTLGIPIAEFVTHVPKLCASSPEISAGPGVCSDERCEAQIAKEIGGKAGTLESPPYVSKDVRRKAANGIVSCTYGQTFQGVAVSLEATFLDGRLAILEVRPGVDTGACFDLLPPKGCAPYRQGLWQVSTGKLGDPTILMAAGRDLRAWRWENDVSVAEFQNHACVPWGNGEEGWVNTIFEVLNGRFCVPGDTAGPRFSIMYYLDKNLSRVLAKRLRVLDSPGSQGAEAEKESTVSQQGTAKEVFASTPQGPSLLAAQNMQPMSIPLGCGYSNMDSIARPFVRQYHWYIIGMTSKIKQNWLLLGHQNIPAVYLTFEIARDGKIGHVVVERSSGNPALDNSALKAMARIDTFAPLPTDFQGDPLFMEFCFDPR